MNPLHDLPNFVSSNPIAVNRSETVERAIELIKQTEIGCVLVVNDDDQLVGVVTGKDLVLKVLAQKKDIASTRVEEIMTASPSSLRSDRAIDLVEVARAMARSRVRRLPIVDEHKHPVGVVSLEDVLVEVGEVVASLRTAVSSDVTVGRMRASQVSSSASKS